MPKSSRSTEPRNFESALGDLEALVQNMESGKLPLEDSLEAYQRGMELLRYCQAKLTAAEQKVRVLEDGELKPLRVEGEGGDGN